MNTYDGRPDIVGINDFTSFVWGTYSGGFSWFSLKIPDVMKPRFVEIYGRSHPFTDPRWGEVELLRPTPDPESRGRRTDPLDDEPTLFLEFAAINPADRDSIRGFADRHGELGDPGFNRLTIERVVRKCEADPAVRPGDLAALRPLWEESGVETYFSWATAITELKTAVATWESLGAGQARRVARYFTQRPVSTAVIAHPRWTPSGGRNPEGMRFVRVQDYSGNTRNWWYFDSHPDLPPGVEPEGTYRFAEPIRSGDAEAGLEEVATQWLRKAINDHLISSVELCLMPGESSLSSVFRIRPTSLLSAIWFQFARAVTGNKQFKRCRRCDRPFPYFPEDGRKARQVFCGAVCKANESRHRREQCHVLRSQGKTPKQIADELGTDIETVRGWLKKK